MKSAFSGLRHEQEVDLLERLVVIGPALRLVGPELEREDVVEVGHAQQRCERGAVGPPR